VDAVLAIRGDAIRSSAALWIDDQPAPAEADAWFDEHLQSGSLLVAVDASDPAPGTVLGFAAFGPLRDYSGYRFTAEDSVYLLPQAQGRGVGGALLRALVERAGELGMHSMCAFIEAENAASIRLHARAGFTEVGRIPQAGTKFGRWLDLVIMQRLLEREDAVPEA
jgi:L-amino acid N-acyltransferase YncA